MSRICALIVGILLWSACTKDGTEYTTEMLIGQWNLAEGYKNGQPSSLLDKLYFRFSEDVMFSNVLGDEQPVTYTLTDDLITTEGPRLINYLIGELNDSTLVLHTTIQKHEFSFVLHRLHSEQMNH
jgi:hypothetical protein